MSYLRERGIPGALSLFGAIIFPAIVIVIELLSGLCADALFDPIPTPAHLALIAAVPAINALLWRAERRESGGSAWLIVAGGGAIAVSAAYALLLLPVLPFAIIAILFFGIGLLPYGPVFAAIFACRWTFSQMAERGKGWRQLGCGIAAGLLLLVLADLPATATHLALNRYQGNAAEQREAIELARRFADTDILLRLSYGDTARATGLFSFLLSSPMLGFGPDSDRSVAARELYYRLTGKPFNASEAPSAGFLRRESWLSRWDDDQGGESVGGRVRDLSLASSRIDGSIATADSLGYFEWTFEVANGGLVDAEARFTIAMPEGAVASRATLWVNGEPREASIARRGAARAAYQSIVRSSRDPLLVTTDGAQRLLVQAFPIFPGRPMKFRIGFTAPFEIGPDGRRSLPLPAIVERNFEHGAEIRHAIWVEADGPIAGRGGLLGGQGNILRAELPDETLLARRPRIAAAPIAAPAVRLGQVGASGDAGPIVVAQTLRRVPAARPPALMIVADGSAGNRGAAAALLASLDRLPPGLPVGLIMADQAERSVAITRWSAEQRARMAEAIAGSAFAGGEDNIPALLKALEAMPRSGGAILWVHGPQPLVFGGSAGRLEQWLERAPAKPRLFRYQAQPGRALVLSGQAWFETAREVVPSGDPARDLRRAVARAAGQEGWAVDRVEAPAGGANGSAHIVRLWAADRIAAMDAPAEKERAAAIGLAHRLNLVTPLTGAVVLETRRDYEQNGLPVPSAEDVPTVPEPGTWALIFLVAAFGLWLWRRRAAQAFA